MRTPLVAANWKMNGDLARVAEWLGAAAQLRCAGVEVALLPPFVYLPMAQQRLRGGAVVWGAQDVAEHVEGAYTGEVSAPMLAELGCRYALVGHSERRALFGDDDARVVAKFRQAQGAGLVPILCVGETLDERERGRTEAVVAAQVGALLDACGVQALAAAVVAYEPVWAIGTGRSASVAQAQSVHEFIRGIVAKHDAKIAASLRLLYGGSVKAANASDLFAAPDIDGALVGGASLDTVEFAAIVDAADRKN